ncbi:Lcl domain-containing protein [Methylophilus aquaticus]|uniref:DUF1566 domain-containing protein n=1 Tax=Methylophilus aquaticus TaxID=1971610 RepID=A0ABT9JTZ4_9PROT|nr:DUF1566 domain-containing protein [Methylophilus aquaticus]MDP8567580.1 DUF1566 domain-containing protein [Methylophilus aquaticus]
MIKLNQAAIKSSLAAATLALSAFSLNAHATLTSYTSAGVDVVYSSVSDVTWTKDANLLGSMIAADSSVINKILAASSNNYGSLAYTVSANDFSTTELGRTSWYGANAFISYLNSISYAGSNQWRLPGVVNTSIGTNTATNGTIAGDELVELFYSELSGTANSAMPKTATFDNERVAYWSGTEHAVLSGRAWYFTTANGRQDRNFNNNRFYAWAVTSGQITTTATPSAVPVPAAALLFGSGLVGLAGLRRRKQQA